MWYLKTNDITTAQESVDFDSYFWLFESASNRPTKSPVTLAPTVDNTCLRVATGGARYDNGYLDVFVDEGDGTGYVLRASGYFALNSVVVADCYTDLVGVQVRNTNANAWAGSIETSVDGGNSYSPMICSDGCSPVGDSTASIVVDGDGNGNRPVKCLNGDTCTLDTMA